MPQDVIDRVHNLVRRAAANVALTFGDRFGEIIPDDDDDDDNDEDYVPPDEASNSGDDDNSYTSDDDYPFDEADDQPDPDPADVAGVMGYFPENNGPNAAAGPGNTNVNDAAEPGNMDAIEQFDNANEEAPGNNNNNEADEPANIDDNGNNAENENNNPIDAPVVEPDANASTESDDETYEPPEEGSESGESNETEDHDTDQVMEQLYGPRSSAHGLRPRKPRTYEHLHATAGDKPSRNASGLLNEPYGINPTAPVDYNHMFATLAHIATTQMSMKKGLKAFGEEGVDAVLAELQQLHDRKVLEPQDASQMTRGDKSASLNYLMFLKKKRSGKIKGRGCADGRKQRLHTKKEDASSPTVAIEAVMLSCVIDAEEERDVAIIDIPGAFMQVDMDEIVHMRLEGKMAELLVHIDPNSYEKYTVYESGKPVIYVMLKKALYGTLRAALLFWKRLSSQLKEWGFVSNPYDPCVANKTINGRQCTVLVWHVDDLKISHIDPEVVTSIIDLVAGEFGKEAPLTIHRGKVHEYLGMTIGFSDRKKVKLSMIDYVQTILDELPVDMDGENSTPAANFLFDVDEDCERLDAETSEMFHQIKLRI